MSGTEEVLDMIGDAIDDWEVSSDAMRCGAPEAAVPVGTYEWPGSDTVTVFLTVDTRPYMEAMSRYAAAMADLYEQYDVAGLAAKVRAFLRAPAAATKPDVHHPPPLAIDGHAYRRRVRNRRKS